jgi:hypothetical protein
MGTAHTGPRIAPQLADPHSRPKRGRPVAPAVQRQPPSVRPGLPISSHSENDPNPGALMTAEHSLYKLHAPFSERLAKISQYP